MAGRIDIISYYYDPEKTPRAYRAAELAREFSRRGYDVRIITPAQAGVALTNSGNPAIHYISPGYFFHRKKVVASSSAGGQGFAGKWLVRQMKVLIGLFIWPADRTFEWQQRVLEFYKHRQLGPPIAIISIGLPVSAHAAAIKVKRFYGKEAKIVFIADYGDPYSLNPVFNTTWLDRIKEGRLLHQFNYLTIPVQDAIPAFTALGVDPKTIRVIPQGFEKVPLDKTQLRLETFTGVYGGRFYAGIREPGPLFQAIALANKTGIRVQLIVYTDPNMELVKKALADLDEQERAGIQIRPLLDRVAFIHEMRKAHFAVNILNRSEFQVPSKQLDFAEAGVPVLLIEPHMGATDIVKKIEERSFIVYSADEVHDIGKVADSFMELIEPDSRKENRL